MVAVFNRVSLSLCLSLSDRDVLKAKFGEADEVQKFSTLQGQSGLNKRVVQKYEEFQRNPVPQGS